MEMKLHALRNLTLKRGEFPNIPYIGNEQGIHIVYKLSTIRQNGLKKYPDAIFSEQSKLSVVN